VALNTIKKQTSVQNLRPLNIQVMLISDCKMKVVKYYWIFGLKQITKYQSNNQKPYIAE